MYHLHRALNAGRIDLERFLRVNLITWTSNGSRPFYRVDPPLVFPSCQHALGGADWMLHY